MRICARCQKFEEEGETFNDITSGVEMTFFWCNECVQEHREQIEKRDIAKDLNSSEVKK